MLSDREERFRDGNVMNGDTDLFKQLVVGDYEGRLPETPDEIAVEEAFLEDNGIDLKTELAKRYSETRVKLIMNPSGRSEFSGAITDLIDVLTDLGLYEQKNNRNSEFVPTFVYKEKNGRIRGYQEIVHTDEPIEQPKDKVLVRLENVEDKK